MAPRPTSGREATAGLAAPGVGVFVAAHGAAHDLTFGHDRSPCSSARGSGAHQGPDAVDVATLEEDRPNAFASRSCMRRNDQPEDVCKTTCKIAEVRERCSTKRSGTLQYEPMSELVALNWKQDADFQTLVMVTEKALEKIATERFGVHPMEKLWSVLGPTIRSEISKWKSDPKISRTEILISLFDGDTTRILNVADWKGPSAGSRVSLRDTFKSETYDDLRTRLEALKTRRAALDEVEAKRTADTDYDVTP